MNVESSYNSLQKKSNGLVSYGTIQKVYGLSTGALNRALEGIDTSDGISLEGFQRLADKGLIDLTPAPAPIPIEGEIVDLSSQLALFNGSSPSISHGHTKALAPIAAQSYQLNGKLKRLMQLQSENQQLQSEIETLQINRETGLTALEKVSVLEAQLEAENLQLRRAREIERIEAAALEQRLKIAGIVGKSLES